MRTLMFMSFGVAIAFSLIYALDRRLTLAAQKRRMVRLLAVSRLQQHTQPIYPVPMVGEHEYIRPFGAA